MKRGGTVTSTQPPSVAATTQQSNHNPARLSTLAHNGTVANHNEAQAHNTNEVRTQQKNHNVASRHAVSSRPLSKRRPTRSLLDSFAIEYFAKFLRWTFLLVQPYCR